MVRISQVVHVLHGLTAGFLWFVDWKVSLFLFLQFFAYEYVEETKVKDEMYHELREWSAGFAVALVTVLLVKSLFRTVCI
jgi:hypothetical protein